MAQKILVCCTPYVSTVWRWRPAAIAIWKEVHQNGLPTPGWAKTQRHSSDLLIEKVYPSHITSEKIQIMPESASQQSCIWVRLLGLEQSLHYTEEGAGPRKALEQSEVTCWDSRAETMLGLLRSQSTVLSIREEKVGHGILRKRWAGKYYLW